MRTFRLLISFAVAVSSLDIVTFADAAKPAFPKNSAQEHRMILQDRAILHANMMNSIGLCRVPRPIIIYPPSAQKNKNYLPRGTLIYRCTDQTGCCPNAGEACRPDTIVEIEKVFFVNHLVIAGQRLSGNRLAPRLKAPRQNFTTLTETITFLNHTSCKCVKLPPDSIEHDDQQSVVSRPLVVPINQFSARNYAFYAVGTATLIGLLIALVVVYRCCFANYIPLQHDQVH